MHLQPTVHHFWFNHLLVEKSTKLFLIKNSKGKTVKVRNSVLLKGVGQPRDQSPKTCFV